MGEQAQVQMRASRLHRFLLLSLVALSVSVAPNLAHPLLAQEAAAAPSPTDIIQSLQSQQFDEALRLSQLALRKYPADKRLWTLRGMALSGKASNAEALGSFKHALSLDPRYLPALEGAAQAAFRKGSPEARAFLATILSAHPEDPTSNAMLGFLQYRAKDCKDAVASFERGQVALSSDENALGAYGYCLAMLERYDEAADVFSKALNLDSELDAQSQQIRLDLALVQWRANHAQQALATVQPLVDASPALPAAQLLSASIDETLQDTPHAVEQLRKVILQDPKNVEAYLDFASLAFDHDAMQVGVDYLTAGLTQLPREPNLYLARGVLQAQLGRFPEAAEDFAKANELDPHLSISTVAQGLVASQEHQSAEALNNFRSAAKAHPDDALAQYLLAEALSEESGAADSADYKEEVAAAERASRLDPHMVAAHDLLATAYLRNNEPQKAIDQCRAALAADPNDQQAVYHLILALRKTNAKDEIPDLLKKLNQLRSATPQGSQTKRFRLEEVPADSSAPGLR
jgi:tetratricopeptide (TPR) repeat protein